MFSSGRAVPLQTYQSKYGELLNVIEDLGREIKPTYAGSKMAQERLKKGRQLLFSHDSDLCTLSNLLNIRPGHNSLSKGGMSGSSDNV